MPDSLGKQINRPELLAPAGEMAALRAAVENGADAVYLGGKAFSARASAVNFSQSELEEAVQYAHLRGVKIYVTINTLIDDQEMSEVLEYVYFLHSIGVDALIIQDLGLLFELKRVFPEIRLHGSTQMTVHNADGVNLLAEKGIDRVVLAREVSLEDISKIRTRTPCELEIFIHGALCICYSGLCLMSSLIGGRSGNRGRCAQPCRLDYRLEQKINDRMVPLNNKRVQHLLSTRDLNTLKILPNLVRAGVNSFKIEGRMKRPEYVATVVRIYREVINRFLDNPDRFKVNSQEEKELEQIFNRQFTTGYLEGNPGYELMSYQRPNNRGTYLGRINRLDRKNQKFQIKLEEKLQRGDGIEIWVSRGGRQGVTIDRMQVKGENRKIAYPNEEVIIEGKVKANLGDRVFKTHDAQLIKQAVDSYSEIKWKIPLQVKVTAAIGKPMILEANDPDGNQCRVETEFIVERARFHPLTEDFLYQQLNRLGNTVFKLEKLDCELESEVMVPVSEINLARRKIVSKLEEQRLVRERKPFVPREVYNMRINKKRSFSISRHNIDNHNEIKKFDRPLLSVAVGDLASAWEAINAGANQVYLPGLSFRSKRKQDQVWRDKVWEAAKRKNVRLLATLPWIISEKHRDIVYRQVEDWRNQHKNDATGWLVGNLGGLKLLQEQGDAQTKDSKVFADYSLNCFNQYTVKMLKSLGFQQVTLSPELSQNQLSGFNPGLIPLEILVHGSLPLMISEHCVVGGIMGKKNKERTCTAKCQGQHFYLKDRLGFHLPLEMDEYCRMYIYNPKILDLIEQLGEIISLGFSSFRLEVRRASPDYVREVVRIYNLELDRLQEQITLKNRYYVDKGSKIKFIPLPQSIEKLKSLAPEGLTRGHYFRGVISLD